MAPPHDYEAFWLSTALHIFVNPHRAQDAEGLAEFAAGHEATRNLLYFQTSGSEGVPKWVGLPREAFLISARAVNAHLAVRAGDRWLIALPLHHVGGFAILARCHAADVEFISMPEKWDAVGFAGRCEREGVTLTSLVPTQVFDLVQAGIRAPRGLRAVVVGGGALTRDIGLRAVELGWPLLQSYGMTEACSQIATEPLEHLHAGFDPARLEVLPCWDLETDELGTLTVRGSALASGYAVHRDGVWRWEPIDGTRGLVTRDRVQLSEHGSRSFLRFLGREGSFVKVLGELVNVAALQTRLEGFAVGMGLSPGAVVILALPDARRETRLLLAGEVAADALEHLRGVFNACSARYEHLGSACAVATLPRTALGKLDVQAALRLTSGVAAAQYAKTSPPSNSSP